MIPHGPKIDSGYLLCTIYAWGLCPSLGMEIYSEKSLAPRNLSGINLGTTPVGTTHGIFLVTTVETCGNYRVTVRKTWQYHALNYYLGTLKFHFRTPTPLV